jgi:hypothetical protein
MVRGLSMGSPRPSVGQGGEVFAVARGPRDVATVTSPVLQAVGDRLTLEWMDVALAVTERAQGTVGGGSAQKSQRWRDVAKRRAHRHLRGLGLSAEALLVMTRRRRAETQGKATAPLYHGSPHAGANALIYK